MDALINTAIAQKIANRKESTRDGSYYSLLGEKNKDASSASNQLQHSKSNRLEQLESMANGAIAKTIADDEENKKSTLRKSPDTEVGEEKGKQNEIPKVKNVGFVNYKWTEILVEDEGEGEEIDRQDMKKAIIQMMKKEENNPLDNWTDKFIRVNRKTYVLVEVAKDRSGRMIYTPIIPTEKPKMSFGAEIQTPSESETEDCEQHSALNDITEVKYPQARRICKKTQNPDVKINLDTEIINKGAKSNHTCNKQYQTYRSCLTKKELLNLTNEEINLDEDQSINLVEIIDRASVKEHTKTTGKNTQDEWEKRAEEIRSELKRACIEIESKGLAECRQTDIINHEMKMKDTKPIKHKIRPVPYHSRKEFEQIIKDQLA